MAKALDEGHGPGLGLGVSQCGSFNQKGGNGAGDNLQHKREQGRMG